MKHIKHWLPTMALLLCSITASAHDFEVDGIYYNITSEEDLTVAVTYKNKYPGSAINEYSGEEIIPATVTYNDVVYSVTSIRDYAFASCSNLTSITIPEGVTKIEHNAFDGCSSLTSITIPESVTVIENYAFSGTAWYDNQRDGLIYAGKVLYKYKGTMPVNTSIEVREGTVSISDLAFDGCSGLTSITIPESVTWIGSGAFMACTNLKIVTVLAVKPPLTSNGDPFLASQDIMELRVPEDAVEAYKSAAWHWNLFTNIKPIITSLSQISNTQLYYFSQLHHSRGVTSWIVGSGDTELKSSAQLGIEPDASDARQHFAIISHDGGATRYLYHAAEKKFVCKDGSLSSKPVDAIYFKDGAYENTFVAYFDNSHYVNVDGYRTISINGWSTADGGNSSLILSAGAYDPTEVPENITLTIGQYGSGTYCSEYALDFSEVEGLKAYVAAGYDSETGVVTLLRVMTANAGVGLFVKGEPGDYVVPTLENTSYNALNMLVGTLEETTVNSTDGSYTNYKYTIREGDAEPKFYPFADASTQAAGRAYLQIPTAWLPTATAQSISYRFDDGETTGIENSKLEIENSTVIFDLMGRRVANPTKGGIYIVNGKKTVF